MLSDKDKRQLAAAILRVLNDEPEQEFTIEGIVLLSSPDTALAWPAITAPMLDNGDVDGDLLVRDCDGIFVGPWPGSPEKLRPIHDAVHALIGRGHIKQRPEYGCNCVDLGLLGLELLKADLRAIVAGGNTTVVENANT